MAIGGWRWRSIGGGILEILLESLGPSQGEEGRRGGGGRVGRERRVSSLTTWALTVDRPRCNLLRKCHKPLPVSGMTWARHVTEGAAGRWRSHSSTTAGKWIGLHWKYFIFLYCKFLHGTCVEFQSEFDDLMMMMIFGVFFFWLRKCGNVASVRHSWRTLA